MESEHNKIASRSGRKCPKMTKILFPLATSLEGSQHNLQHKSTPVWLPAWEKTAKIGRVLFEQIGLEGLVQTRSSFGNRGQLMSLRMVPFDRRQNFLYFLFPGSYATSHHFGVTAWKLNFRKRKLVATATSLRWIENRRSDHSSTDIAKPNGENNVKIRPVEVEIMGLTKIAKKEIRYRRKTYGYPVAKLELL